MRLLLPAAARENCSCEGDAAAASRRPRLGQRCRERCVLTQGGCVIFFFSHFHGVCRVGSPSFFIQTPRASVYCYLDACSCAVACYWRHLSSAAWCVACPAVQVSRPSAPRTAPRRCASAQLRYASSCTAWRHCSAGHSLLCPPKRFCRLCPAALLQAHARSRTFATRPSARTVCCGAGRWAIEGERTRALASYKLSHLSHQIAHSSLHSGDNEASLHRVCPGSRGGGRLEQRLRNESRLERRL